LVDSLSVRYISTKCSAFLWKEWVVKAAITPRYKRQRRFAPDQHPGDGSNSADKKQHRKTRQAVLGISGWTKVMGSDNPRTIKLAIRKKKQPSTSKISIVFQQKHEIGRAHV
jgi:hypothetical protein